MSGEKSVRQLGLHVPSGIESVPLLQRMDRLAEAVKIVVHEGVQMVPLGIGDQQEL